MKLTFDKVAAILNTLCALGASLQASGQLVFLGPKGMAIAVAVITVLNAISHALAPAPVASAAPKD